MNAPVLISGGDGFLGRALCRYFTAHGRPVVVIDDHSSSGPQPPRRFRRVIDADVARVEREAIPRVSAVLHLASPATPALFACNAMRIMRSNIAGTEALAEIARRDGCRMLFTSTSEVYGTGDPSGPPDQAFHEEQPVAHRNLTTRSCYAAAKRVGEEIVLAARRSGLDAASLRLFNVYGPGMDPTLSTYGRVVPCFLGAVERGEPLPIHGEGHQVRSFLWVDDFVEAVAGLVDYRGELPPVLNVGRDEPIRIEDLARLFERAAGETLGRRRLPRPVDDPDWRRPDCTRIRKLIGWAPAVSIAEGVRLLVDEIHDIRRRDVAACR